MRQIRIVPLALAGLALAVPARADDIHYTDGRVVRGVEIISETYEAIEYKFANIPTPQKEPAKNVLRVVHTEPPPAYEAATGQMKGGRYDEAIAQLAKALAAPQPWVKQYVYFETAECLRLKGSMAEAAKAYAELLEKEPKSVFAPHAHSGIGTAYLAQGNAAKAGEAFAMLEKEAEAKGFGDRWKARARLGLGRVALQEKDAKGARSRFEQVYREVQASEPMIATEAAILESQARVELGEADGAIRQLREILEKSTSKEADEDLLASAANALGRAWLKKGDPKEALLAFLRVVVQFEGARGELPEALYSAANCFEQAKGKDADKRAKDLRDRLRKEFPSSPWATKGSS